MKAIVPARGNSKGIRRKNLAIVDGKPLLLHICHTLAEAGHEVIVSTEDSEIASVALLHGYNVHNRSPELSEDDVPVSAVVVEAAVDLQITEPIIVAQPTCPNITVETLNRLVEKLSLHQAVTVATPNTHILRDGDGRFTEVSNRQYQTNPVFREVGVRAFQHPSLADMDPTGFVEVDETEALDIDTHAELHSTAPRRTIQFHVTGNRWVGHGHIHRTLALANELQHHDILFYLRESDDQATALIERADWPLIPIAYPSPDLAVVDTLDTTVQQIAQLKAGNSLVVTIEDLGPGAELADLTVNALYPQHLGHEKTGGRWADLRPEFIGLPPYPVRDVNYDTGRILLMFGGTDPAGLGEKFGKWFPNATLVEQGADVSVAALMREHDLLITSAGRTVYEAAAVGIPSVVVAANAREARHSHLGWGHGNVFLGHGRLLEESAVRNTVNGLLNDAVLRQELSERARSQVDGLGLQRISYQVDGLLKGLL